MEFLRLKYKRNTSVTLLYLHPVLIGAGQRKEVLLVTDVGHDSEGDDLPQWMNRATMELDREQVEQMRDWLDEWLKQ